jgi:5'(3')-deoxyribonucleotidase
LIENKLVVCIDLDDTLYPFVSTILKKYNKKYQDDLSVRYITDYNIRKFIKPECINIFQEFANKKLFKKIIIFQEVIDALTEINDKYELYFLTAGHPKTTRYRDKLLSRYLPWYSSGQLISCRNKWLVKTDVLVDDCVDNVNNIDGVGILIRQPWNMNSGYCKELTCEKFNKSVVDIIDGLTNNLTDNARVIEKPSTQK